jgi:hypothetical protein
MKSAKVHFVVSETPIGTGSHVVALCGYEIWDANLKHVFDDVPVGERMDFRGLGGCSRCEKSQLPKFSGRAFVYAISDSVEASNQVS